MELRYLDLFAGVGGFRLAVERACAGTKVKPVCVGFSEIDKYAKSTYSANFTINPGEDLGDVMSLNIASIPNFDILFAGFPCQPFSMMGMQKGFADTRGTLFFQIEKIIAKKRPSVVVLENVRGLLNHDDGKTYSQIIKILEEKLKYKTKTLVLNSSEFGVPQTRRRLYIVCLKNPKKAIDKIDPLKTDLKQTSVPTTWHLLDKHVDEKYYLSPKILKTILSNGSGNFKSKSEINQIIARPLTATMHKMHRACQDNYFSDSYIFGKFDGKTGLVSLRKKQIDRVRKITPAEAFKLQGFPANFVENAKKRNISDTQLFKQAGNAITVNVAQSVIKSILSEL